MVPEIWSVVENHYPGRLMGVTEVPIGEVCLAVTLPDGSAQQLTAITKPAEANGQEAIIARIAAALKLRGISDEAIGRQLAVSYQLVSTCTNYLAVLVRDEADKADTLPELHKVQQMLAAGWGGTGSIRYGTASRTAVSDSAVNYSLAKFSMVTAPFSAGFDRPTFLRSSADFESIKTKRILKSDVDEDRCNLSISNHYQDDDPWLWEQKQSGSMDQFIELLNTTLDSGTIPQTIHLPLLPAGIKTVLALLVEEGIGELTVVTVFLHHLAGSAAGSKLSRQTKRVIAKQFKELNVDSNIVDLIEERLKFEMMEAVFDEDQYDATTFLRKNRTLEAAP
jgi:Ca-activated chloride channel family protein